jgi:hypothetical protein
MKDDKQQDKSPASVIQQGTPLPTMPEVQQNSPEQQARLIKDIRDNLNTIELQIGQKLTLAIVGNEFPKDAKFYEQSAEMYLSAKKKKGVSVISAESIKQDLDDYLANNKITAEQAAGLSMEIDQFKERMSPGLRLDSPKSEKFSLAKPYLIENLIGQSNPYDFERSKEGAASKRDFQKNIFNKIKDKITIPDNLFKEELHSKDLQDFFRNEIGALFSKKDAKLENFTINSKDINPASLKDEASYEKLANKLNARLTTASIIKDVIYQIEEKKGKPLHADAKALITSQVFESFKNMDNNFLNEHQQQVTSTLAENIQSKVGMGSVKQYGRDSYKNLHVSTKDVQIAVTKTVSEALTVSPITQPAAKSSSILAGTSEGIKTRIDKLTAETKGSYGLKATGGVKLNEFNHGAKVPKPILTTSSQQTARESLTTKDAASPKFYVQTGPESWQKGGKIIPPLPPKPQLAPKTPAKPAKIQIYSAKPDSNSMDTRHRVALKFNSREEMTKFSMDLEDKATSYGISISNKTSFSASNPNVLYIQPSNKNFSFGTYISSKGELSMDFGNENLKNYFVEVTGIKKEHASLDSSKVGSYSLQFNKDVLSPIQDGKTNLTVKPRLAPTQYVQHDSLVADVTVEAKAASISDVITPLSTSGNITPAQLIPSAQPTTSAQQTVVPAQSTPLAASTIVEPKGLTPTTRSVVADIAIETKVGAILDAPVAEASIVTPTRKFDVKAPLPTPSSAAPENKQAQTAPSGPLAAPAPQPSEPAATPLAGESKRPPSTLISLSESATNLLKLKYKWDNKEAITSSASTEFDKNYSTEVTFKDGGDRFIQVVNKQTKQGIKIQIDGGDDLAMKDGFSLIDASKDPPHEIEVDTKSANIEKAQQILADINNIIAPAKSQYIAPAQTETKGGGAQQLVPEQPIIDEAKSPPQPQARGVSEIPEAESKDRKLQKTSQIKASSGMFDEETKKLLEELNDSKKQSVSTGRDKKLIETELRIQLSKSMNAIRLDPIEAKVTDFEPSNLKSTNPAIEDDFRKQTNFGDKDLGVKIRENSDGVIIFDTKDLERIRVNKENFTIEIPGNPNEFVIFKDGELTTIENEKGSKIGQDLSKMLEDIDKKIAKDNNINVTQGPTNPTKPAPSLPDTGLGTPPPPNGPSEDDIPPPPPHGSAKAKNTVGEIDYSGISELFGEDKEPKHSPEPPKEFEVKHGTVVIPESSKQVQILDLVDKQTTEQVIKTTPQFETSSKITPEASSQVKPPRGPTHQASPPPSEAPKVTEIDPSLTGVKAEIAKMNRQIAEQKQAAEDAKAPKSKFEREKAEDAKAPKSKAERLEIAGKFAKTLIDSGFGMSGDNHSTTPSASRSIGTGKSSHGR